MKNSPASTSLPLPSSSQPRQTIEVIPPKGPSLEQEVIQLRREKDALSQLLWETVRQASPDTHTLEVPAAVSDPLWLLAFVPGSKAGTAKILAGTMPPISEQEKKRVVRLLRGTAKPMAEALAELELPYPESYVEREIAAHVVWKKSVDDAGGARGSGTWDSVRKPDIGEQLKNVLRIPKS